METSPRWLRCYDNGGESADRYTVLFVGRRGGFGVAASEYPTHPQGIYQHFDWKTSPPDVRSGAWSGPPIGKRCHLGERVAFESLPETLRRLVLAEYREVWA